MLTPVRSEHGGQRLPDVNLTGVYIATGAFFVLLLFFGQSWLLDRYLTWLNTNRGAVIQALVYVAQSVILLYVLVTSLRQFRTLAVQTETSEAELATLQRNVNAATLQNILGNHRGIMDIAIARPEILSRLQGQEIQEVEVRTQAFADILINHAYNAYLQHTLSVLPQGIWDTLRPGVLNVFRSPYVRSRWAAVRHNYRGDFVDLIETSLKTG